MTSYLRVRLKQNTQQQTETTKVFGEAFSKKLRRTPHSQKIKQPPKRFPYFPTIYADTSKT